MRTPAILLSLYLLFPGCSLCFAFVASGGESWSRITDPRPSLTAPTSRGSTFSVTPMARTRVASPSRSSVSQTKTSLHAMNPAEKAASTMNTLLLSSTTESWRQYVPLVVSGLVLLDILLGSPAANSVLKIVQRRVDDKNAADATTSSSASQAQSLSSSDTTTTTLPKPRIDIDAVVDQAMGKAESVQSLRAYLDARKTDTDRMQEIRRAQDQQMARLDQKNARDLEV